MLSRLAVGAVAVLVLVAAADALRQRGDPAPAPAPAAPAPAIGLVTPPSAGVAADSSVVTLIPCGPPVASAAGQVDLEVSRCFVAGDLVSSPREQRARSGRPFRRDDG